MMAGHRSRRRRRECATDGCREQGTTRVPRVAVARRDSYPRGGSETLGRKEGRRRSGKEKGEGGQQESEKGKGLRRQAARRSAELGAPLHAFRAALAAEREAASASVSSGTGERRPPRVPWSARWRLAQRGRPRRVARASDAGGRGGRGRWRRRRSGRWP